MTKTLTNKNHPEGSSGVCMVSFIPMRKAPREQSEMISQLLFGEYYRIEESMDKWLKVTSLFDHITGWIDRKFFREADMQQGTEYTLQSVLFCKIAEIEMPDGSLQLIPAGSSLPLYDQSNHEFRVGMQKFRIRPLFENILLPVSQKISETAARFMNTPYLWGGRSVFGFDCSGFIQTVYKIHGVALGRDTSHQVLAGELVPALKNAVPGDLAFFSNDDGKVNHVGLVLAKNEIIHCSGWVRVDRLDEKGIFDRERGIYTHRLMVIRRVTG
jgi:gamma-D-glutamyl-L-lysine dipeptidyl-peptidase